MDISYLLFLQNFRATTNDIFSNFFLFVTKFGEPEFTFILLLGTYWCFNKDLGRKLIISNYFMAFINGILKLCACVYRPWIRDARIEPYGDAKVTATGYSFPSGHTTSVTSVYGYLAYLYRNKKTLSFSLGVVMLLVMFSRNYLGVHTPQDVVFGFLTTVVGIIFLEILFKWEEKKEGRDILIVISSIFVVIIGTIFVMNKAYPIDYVENGKLLVDPVAMQTDFFKGASGFVGVIIGWLLEKRYIRFTIPKDNISKMARFVPGMIIAFALMKILDPFLSLYLSKVVAKVIAGIFNGIFIVAIYPYIFTKLESKTPSYK